MTLSIQDGTRFDLPVIEAESAQWWEGIRDGRLLLEHCATCGDSHLYPRSFCPLCWNEDVSLVPSSGFGVLYTYSIVRVNDLAPFKERLPYTVAMVELEEGPRLMSNLVDVPEAQLAIGMPLRLVVQPLTDTLSIPMFTAFVR